MQTLPHAAPHRHRNDQQGGQERTTVATVATATPRRAPSHGVAAVSHGRELV